MRRFYASWGPTLKGEDDIRRISAELVAGDAAVLDAFNSRLRARFHGTCLSSTPVSPWADNLENNTVSHWDTNIKIQHIHELPRAVLPETDARSSTCLATCRRKSRQKG